METLSSLAYEPPELGRVREHSAPSVNQKLDRQTADCVQHYSRTQKEINAERRALEHLLNTEREANTKTQIAS